MEKKLDGIKIGVLGGDDRELVLIPRLASLGAELNIVGFPSLPHAANIRIVSSIDQAIENVDAVLLPMPGTDLQGNIRAIYAEEKLVLTESVVKKIPPKTPVIVGVAKPFLKEWAEKYQLKLIEIAEVDEVAILNAIPTAEGAVQLAMEHTNFTIHSSNSFVIGFGRVGFTMARTLAALGANVTIVARKPADYARAFELGYQVCNYQELIDKISEAHLIFNTVPALVLTKELLVKVDVNTLIIDLASQPGGTDFKAAADQGVNAILAPGLPGKVAPKTAGEILAKVIPAFILENL
ncbi:MAG: dipicolinate synthase subunit DpsA [Bacillota bacterium]|nr:dipicolinate synthase subunit DpsA [Bacillota bacterium]